MHTPTNYCGYGLIIKSDLFLPELQVSGDPQLDVRIKLGAVPHSLPNPTSGSVTWQVEGNQLLINVYNVARYLVSNGNAIVIEPDTIASEDDIRAFLFGSVWGALLHQRGFLTLHASAVVTKRGAVLFAGKSGAGKSTLATAMGQKGYALLSDDKTAIAFDPQQRAIAIPAYPTRRLWIDSAQRLGQSVNDIQKLRAGLNKYVSRVEHFCSEPQRIHAVFTLQAHNRPNIEYERHDRLSGLSRLLNFTYRKKMLYGLGGRQSQFKMASTLSRAVDVIAIRRPDTPFMLDELVELIEEQIA